MENKLTTKRKSRRSNINRSRNVLTVLGKEPGYQYRIVNDDGDRITQFEEMGYEIVRDTNVQVGDRRIVNPTGEGSSVQVSVGGGMKAYVMRIKDEFYQEDRAAKDRHINDVEKGLARNTNETADYGKISIGA